MCWWHLEITLDVNYCGVQICSSFVDFRVKNGHFVVDVIYSLPDCVASTSVLLDVNNRFTNNPRPARRTPDRVWRSFQFLSVKKRRAR